MAFQELAKLVFGRREAEDVFSVTPARMSACKAFSSILSPSWKSMARLVFPSRLELWSLVRQSYPVSQDSSTIECPFHQGLQ